MILELFDKAIKLSQKGNKISIDIVIENGEITVVDIWVGYKSSNYFGYESPNHIACHSLESAWEELTNLANKINN